MHHRPTHPLVAILSAPPGPATQSPRIPSGKLSSTGVARIAAIAEALFSDDVHPPPAARIDFVADEYADLLSRASRRGRMLFRFAAWWIDRVAPLYIGRWVSLRTLTVSERVPALSAFERGAFGALWAPLRAVLCLVYYEHPDAADEVGFHPRHPEAGSRSTS